MAEMLSNLDAPSDAELISRVRGGDVDAYGQLFARHVESARRLARQLARGPDADDLVSDAFAKVMDALRNGGGPDIAFRAYLLTAVRRLHVDRIRVQSRLTPSDDLSAFDPGVPFQDTVVEQFENGAAARAFASLPERWQMVLWHLEVERQKPAEVAVLLGMTANSVSALAYRAREGLRQAFLSAHLAEIDDADCSWVVEHLGGYVRKGLSKRDQGKVEAHLENCRSCSAMYLELVEVNSNLSGILGPLVLGGLAAGYLAAGGSGVAVGSLLAILDRAKDFVLANTVPVAAGTTAAGVAAAVVISGGVGMGRGGHEPVIDSSRPPSQASGSEDRAPGSATTHARGSASGAARGGSTAAAGPHNDQRGTRPGSHGPTPAAPSATPTAHASGAPTLPVEASGPPTATPSATPPTEPPAGPPSDVPSQSGQNQGDDHGNPQGTPSAQPTKPEPSHPEPTHPSGPPERDVQLTVDGTIISKAVGRFRVHVASLPTAQGSTEIRLDVSFSDSRVHLQSVPHGCSYAGSSAVVCYGNGGSWNGIFDADLSGMSLGQATTITVTGSVPDVSDPDTSNNTGSVVVRRIGS